LATEGSGRSFSDQEMSKRSRLEDTPGGSPKLQFSHAERRAVLTRTQVSSSDLDVNSDNFQLVVGRGVARSPSSRLSPTSQVSRSDADVIAPPSPRGPVVNRPAWIKSNPENSTNPENSDNQQNREVSEQKEHPESPA